MKNTHLGIIMHNDEYCVIEWFRPVGVYGGVFRKRYDSFDDLEVDIVACVGGRAPQTLISDWSECGTVAYDLSNDEAERWSLHRIGEDDSPRRTNHPSLKMAVYMAERGRRHQDDPGSSDEPVPLPKAVIGYRCGRCNVPHEAAGLYYSRTGRLKLVAWICKSCLTMAGQSRLKRLSLEVHMENTANE